MRLQNSNHMLMPFELAAATVPQIDPYAIFSRARQAWAASRYPSHLTYQIVVRATDDGHEAVNHYSASDDVTEDDIKVAATSQEEAAHPYVPHGVNFKATLKLGYSGKVAPVGQHADKVAITRIAPLSEPQETPDILGVPVLAPTYSFGIRPVSELPSQSNATSTPVNSRTVPQNDRLCGCES